MRFIDRFSIRIRITVGTVVLALAVLTGTAIIGHALVKELLDDSTATLLESDIAPYASAIRSEPADSVDTPVPSELILVVDPSGAARASSLPPALREALLPLRSVPTSATEVAVGGSSYLVRAEHVDVSDGRWLVIGARDQSASAITLERLTIGGVIGLAVLVIGFGVLSWVLVGAALRPVERLRRSADRIAATGSTELLPVAPANDEIQHLAATLNELVEELRTSVARERQMVSDASHELRTPLAVLQGRLELLRTGDGSRSAEDIADAEAAARRLSLLVADLLELSRLEAGAGAGAGASAGAGESRPASAHPGPCASPRRLEEEAWQAVDRARFAAAARGIAIDLAVTGDPGPDPDRAAALSGATFGRVVENLLTNAVKASRPGGEVVAELRFTPGAASLTVRDSGHGIPAEFLPRAFDRFARADDSRSAGPGTGLGLSIVAAAAHSAGGTVELENRHGGGARASFQIPMQFCQKPI